MTGFAVLSAGQVILATRINGKIRVETREIVSKLIPVLKIKCRTVRWSEYLNEPRRTIRDEQFMHSALYAFGSGMSVYEIVHKLFKSRIGVGIDDAGSWRLKVR